MQSFLLVALSFKSVFGVLLDHQYLAMFGVLFLCGVGLPLPEEVTLIGSGILVGLEGADFFVASFVCVLGILAGDSIIFGLGYGFGSRFLQSRPMRLLLSTHRQERVAGFFSRHGSKAVFFARFVAGVRVGVYAYAGSQRMSWFRFLLLDFLGAMISGPTSVWLGKFVIQRFVEPPQRGPEGELSRESVIAAAEKAYTRAEEIVHDQWPWVALGVVVLAVLVWWIHSLINRKLEGKPADAIASIAPVPRSHQDA